MTVALLWVRSSGQWIVSHTANIDLGATSYSRSTYIECPCRLSLSFVCGLVRSWPPACLGTLVQHAHGLVYHTKSSVQHKLPALLACKSTAVVAVQAAIQRHGGRRDGQEPWGTTLAENGARTEEWSGTPASAFRILYRCTKIGEVVQSFCIGSCRNTSAELDRIIFGKITITRSKGRFPHRPVFPA